MTTRERVREYVREESKKSQTTKWRSCDKGSTMTSWPASRAQTTVRSLFDVQGATIILTSATRQEGEEVLGGGVLLPQAVAAAIATIQDEGAGEEAEDTVVLAVSKVQSNG
jgi:hypothetical protein